jgi:phosphohistidine phosphatase
MPPAGPRCTVAHGRPATDLILWRHADAADSDIAVNDLECPLTSKGERHAARVAAWVRRRLPSSTRVIASPARRAQQTAAILDRKFRTADALWPKSTVDDLLAAARWPEAGDPVLVVGHQPVLGLVAAILLLGQPLGWNIRKGGLGRLRHRYRGDIERVLLVAALAPEFL